MSPGGGRRRLSSTVRPAPQPLPRPSATKSCPPCAGVRVYVEPKALMHIIGTTMDFVQDELTSEFVFHNPNAEAACGCGESFTTKKPEGEGHEGHGKGGGDS